MMIINEQELKIYDMKCEVVKNAAIKAFMNAHNEISEQMNIIDKTA